MNKQRKPIVISHLGLLCSQQKHVIGGPVKTYFKAILICRQATPATIAIYVPMSAINLVRVMGVRDIDINGPTNVHFQIGTVLPYARSMQILITAYSRNLTETAVPSKVSYLWPKYRVDMAGRGPKMKLEDSTYMF